MLKKILFVVTAALVAFVGFVFTRPDTYEVSRSALVAAPAAVAYAQVADFHKWEAWSPWGKLDPAMKTTFEGTPGEVGSSYAWTGNKDVGSGKMTLTEVKPGELVRIKLEFIEPFAAVSDTRFRFQPEGAGTQVQWSMVGQSGFVTKAMGVFMNMDAMIGKDFEKGLAQLDAASRAEAARLAASPKP